MSSSKQQIVVQGEASETDSDSELYITSLPAPCRAAAGVKVQGEASETDSDEEEGEKARRSVTARTLHKDLSPLTVIRDSTDGPAAVEERPVCRLEPAEQFNTLLQQKLLESNGRLCSDVTQTLRHVYGHASREMRVACGHLSRAQSGIISASHCIRFILDDLRSVSEKIDIITSCHLLPDITIPCSAGEECLS